ncbi:glycine receptor subunit alpha-2-like isoform X2 [Convolutriloba macropyga]|uniref:glycine receptor subunit alpha-2-like isoform X2 n=1 Tax=Convolutriloba macropyga TaxID=536237 RepID=UPI003F52867E
MLLNQHYLSVLIVVTISCVVNNVWSTDNGVSVFLPANYDRGIRPSVNLGVADAVEFDLFIHKVGPIEETSMKMTLDIYFRQYWKDERLLELFEHITSATNGSSHTIQLGRDYLELIWLPDIYWRDALQVSKPGVLSKSSSLELSKDGSIFFSSRLLIAFRCEMKLWYFPFDIQQCHLCFESYLYHADHQNMTWVSEVVDLTASQVTANFYIEGEPTTYETLEHYNLGTIWKNLCLTITLPRKLAIYVITMFLPSISLVILSWVGFWVDKRAVPARSGLSITTILAQITLITGTANQFPGIADLKMGDMYLIVNFFYVFASLIEFALVSYQPPEREKWKKARKGSAKNTFRGRMMNSFRRRHSNADMKGKDSPKERKFTRKPTLTVPKGESVTVRTLFGVNQAILDQSVAPGTAAGVYSPDDPLPEMPVIQYTGDEKTEAELRHVTKFSYWSAGNADEISKWLFPLCFAVWNLVYFLANYRFSGRM